LYIEPPPLSTLIPYTTLFRSLVALFRRKRLTGQLETIESALARTRHGEITRSRQQPHQRVIPKRIVVIEVFVTQRQPIDPLLNQDRKSTRLNSSHVKNSYAVF